MNGFHGKNYYMYAKYNEYLKNASFVEGDGLLLMLAFPEHWLADDFSRWRGRQQGCRGRGKRIFITSSF